MAPDHPSSRQSNLPAHHRGPQGFQNPWPTGGRPGELGSVLRWMVQRARTRKKNPPASSLPRVEPVLPSHSALGDEIAATWLGHSTVLVQCAGLTILTDPVWARRVGPLGVAGPGRWVRPTVAIADLPPVDVVLQSHNHYDHFDVAATRAISSRNPGALWCVPLGMADAVRRCGVPMVTELDWWASSTHDLARAQSGSVRVSAVPAQHFSGRGLTDRNRSLWCGWVIEVDDVRIYFAGDSAHHPEFGTIAERLGPFDLTMLPIGAYEPRWFMSWVHMDPEEAVNAWSTIARVQAEVHDAPPPPMLGIHWGTYKLTDEPMDEPPARTAALWSGAAHPADALWICAHGETRRTPRLRGRVLARANGDETPP
jgi:N-acyl-phosphatidylethanolamine-hydrolysing phospholipase D